jgi:hypothetical protein
VRVVYDLRHRFGNVDDLSGFGSGNVDAYANGYPTDTANANTIPGNATGANHCRNVFNGILTAPGPSAAELQGSKPAALFHLRRQHLGGDGDESLEVAQQRNRLIHPFNRHYLEA